MKFYLVNENTGNGSMIATSDDAIISTNHREIDQSEYDSIKRQLRGRDHSGADVVRSTPGKRGINKRLSDLENEVALLKGRGV